MPGISSQAPLRLALIGSFGHAGDVLNEIESGHLPLEIIGWAPAISGENAAGLVPPGTRLFDTYHELLAERPEWVIVSTRLDRTAAVATDCLQAGVHVIAEKPLAITISDLTSLHRVWKASGRHLSAMLTMENEPAFLAARQVVREGITGRLLLAEARKSYRWGVRPPWFADLQIYGGTFPWIGIHAFDMIHFITGAHFTGGSSHQANLAHPSYPGCQDVCTAVLTTDSGALAQVSVDLARPQSSPSHGDDWCRIVGSEGVLEANASEGWCRLLVEGQEIRQIPLPPRGRRFLQAIDNARTGDLSIAETESAFHLTMTSLLARDHAGQSRSFLVEPAGAV